MSNLGKTLSKYWENIQGFLFPWLEEELDPLTKKQKQLITILEVSRVENFIVNSQWMGRPLKSRKAIGRAFVAKCVYNMNTTRDLIERLKVDINLRRICGFENKSQIPSESTFSRAFDEFANTRLPQHIHNELIKESFNKEIILHVSGDSTAIEARERPGIRSKKKPKKKQRKKRGRPEKGEIREIDSKETGRLDKQPTMTLEAMLNDLPMECDVGCKKNSQGYIEKWTGYKLHISSADGGIPVGAILTSASMHDSQAAIPLITLTAQRVINLYDLFDAAYDDDRIENYSKSLNHVPIIDINPRRDTKLKEDLKMESKARNAINWKTPEEIRYNERTTIERVNGRLKDEFGGRKVRVRGKTKVMCHLMFGLLALTADQLMRLVT